MIRHPITLADESPPKPQGSARPVLDVQRLFGNSPPKFEVVGLALKLDPSSVLLYIQQGANPRRLPVNELPPGVYRLQTHEGCGFLQVHYAPTDPKRHYQWSTHGALKAKW